MHNNPNKINHLEFFKSTRKVSYWSPVHSTPEARRTVHANPSRKRNFSKTLFEPDRRNLKPAFRFRVIGKYFQNGAFRKSSSNRRNLKTPAFRFRVGGKHFENGAFWKRCSHVNHVISLHQVFLRLKSKMTCGRDVFKFLRIVWTWLQLTLYVLRSSLKDCLC